jgi:hypothetical protein
MEICLGDGGEIRWRPFVFGMNVRETGFYEFLTYQRQVQPTNY